ncbi:hypothetical protein IWW36_000527 [Coemansia brasiliensis]|uniref:Uncharacterized protein n=1 Tax=Coemansia brasiliensis TaxID=2650707 RepID=A0A9W8M192_9FUNG|nr:hypothetical protein IWW36_000527 [Coemansia brasiliensis]
MKSLLIFSGILLENIVTAGTVDNCNLAYWKPRLLKTTLVDKNHMPMHRMLGQKLSFYDELPEPKRILGPQTEVREKAIDSHRITVMVDSNNFVIDVDCF